MGPGWGQPFSVELRSPGPAAGRRAIIGVGCNSACGVQLLQTEQRMVPSSTFAGSLRLSVKALSLGLSLFMAGAAFADRGPACEAKPTIAQPNIQKRPTAHVNTWNESISNRQGYSTGQNRDPYGVQVTGYTRKSKVTVAVQEESDSVHDAHHHADRKANGRAAQRSVTEAMKWKPIHEMTITNDSPDQIQAAEVAASLATHAPLHISGTNVAGRKLADPCAGARLMAEMILSNLQPLR